MKREGGKGGWKEREQLNNSYTQMGKRGDGVKREKN